ncbi:MAG: hypothetical protein VCD34_06150 [Planctomycetota bacterium]
MKIRSFPGQAALSLLLALVVGCSSGGHDNPFDLGSRSGGVVSADFQSIDDYLDHPTVQLLLENMPRNTGNAAPEIAGTYDAFGGVVDSTIPGSSTGDSTASYFCFGLASGGALEVNVIDPTIDDSDATSLIEGSGDEFTVYTAFRSVQEHPGGSHCEITKVNIFSGTREPDGSLSDLHVGCGIVGLVGFCDPLRIDQAQISRLAGNLIGDACSSVPQGPADGNKVQLVIENFLLDQVNIYTDPDPNAQASANVDPLGTVAIEIDPGFSLDFESARPSAGTDQNGDDILMGEVVAGAFGQDTTAAGETVTYFIENLVGLDEFFAPRLLNSSGREVFTVVNSDVPTLDFFPYEEPLGSGLDCLCAMPPAPDPYFLGYYSYNSPDYITPSEANIRVFDTTDETEVADPFFGPFSLETGSGDVILEVTD